MCIVKTEIRKKLNSKQIETMLCSYQIKLCLYFFLLTKKMYENMAHSIVNVYDFRIIETFVNSE